MKFDKDMTESEVIELVGKERWKKMAEYMRGQTGAVNEEGKLVMYNYDLEKAYRRISF